MSHSDLRAEPCAHLALQGEMTVYTAARHRDEILDTMRRARGRLELDLSRVSEMDTAGLQLLLVARAAGSALVNPSAAVREVLALCRLQALLEPRAAGGGAP